MYTDGPTNDEFPRNEYREHMIKTIVFLELGHFRSSIDHLYQSGKITYIEGIIGVIGRYGIYGLPINRVITLCSFSDVLHVV